MIKLFFQFPLVDQVCQGNISRSVNQIEHNPDPGMIIQDKLAHEQLIKIGVNQGSDDGVYFPIMIIDPGSYVNVGSKHHEK